MPVEKNCISYWFPILEQTGIAVPQTKIIKTEINLKEIANINTDNDMIKIPKLWINTLGSKCEKFIEEMQESANQTGYPLFLRTGMGAAKHNWKNTCFVKSPDDLLKHIHNLIIWSDSITFWGFPCDVWSVRKYIPMKSICKLFSGEMPIGKERRFFIKDKEILCHHNHWPPFLLEGKCSILEWEILNRELQITESEENILKKIAGCIALSFDEFWSLDFSLGADGKWYAIDMALGECSFHCPGCSKDNSIAPAWVPSLINGQN